MRNQKVRLDGLLFSIDPQVLGIMNQILSSFAIETEVCTELRSALHAVNHRHLDAIIVDWNGSDPTRIVRDARKSSPNSNSTIIAMVDANSETHALLAGANFMIHNPVDLDHARRCMRAAYGTMLQQRRRVARVPVDLRATASAAGLGTLQAQITDLSIGGLALMCKQALPLDREISLLFTLPAANRPIYATGKVVHADAGGRAGFRFSLLSEEDLSLLENWLATELARLERTELPIEDLSVAVEDVSTAPCLSEGHSSKPEDTIATPHRF